MRRPNARTKQRIVNAMDQYARSIPGNWLRWKVQRMDAHRANKFLVGVMLDRGVVGERPWKAADWICEVLGDSKNVATFWKRLRGMEPARLRGFLHYGYGGKAFHRYYKEFARLFRHAAEYLLANHSGDPRQIWNNQRNVGRVKQRLEQLPGIGRALANMAVLALARDYGLLGGKRARQQLDVKPDVQLRRVFVRAGFIEPGASVEAVVDAARQLAPGFSASLDAPAWKIGREWCRPRQPKCSECPVGAVCPRVGVRK